MFAEKKKNEDDIWEVSPQELLQQKSSVQIIDVRRREEWIGELGHIDGASLATLETELRPALESLDKEKPYVFVCKAGGRSSRAAIVAKTKGFREVYSMYGGMTLWNELGLPLARKD